jgi:hypothetical protein
MIAIEDYLPGTPWQDSPSASRPPPLRTTTKIESTASFNGLVNYWWDAFANGHPLEHLPAEQRGMLGPLKPDNYARIRAIVMHRLRGSSG